MADASIKYKRFLKQVIRDNCNSGNFKELGKSNQTDIKNNAEYIADIVLEDEEKVFENTLKELIEDAISIYFVRKNS